jgi:hypothetical protein
MPKRISQFQRMRCELAAEQIGLNPAMKAILDTIRVVNTQPASRSSLQRLAKINKALPLLEFGDPVSGPQRQLGVDRKSRTWFLTAPLAWRCLEAIVDCANTGDLDKFRECPICTKWFFARTKEQEFCSSRCRQKSYTSTAKGRTARSNYMNEYRAKIKAMDKRRDEAYRRSWNRN